MKLPFQVRPLFMHPALYWGCATLAGVLFALQSISSVVLSGMDPNPLPVTLLWVAQAWGWATVGLVVWQLLPYYPVSCATWRGDSGIFALLAISASLLEMSLRLLLRQGMGLVAYRASFARRLSITVRTEVVSDLFVFCFVLGSLRAVEFSRKYHERTLRAAQVEARLTEARLQLMKRQLNPHFLFNTLNSISAIMRHDVDAADEMLDRLGRLLRLALARDNEPQVRLQSELAFLEEYLALQRIRFADRLQVVMDISPEARDVLVPSMLLQPLVENAVVHGVAKLPAGRIVLTATIKDETLILRIENDAPQEVSRGKRTGIGLRNTRERLNALYGDKSLLEVRKADGHVETTVLIPAC